MTPKKKPPTKLPKPEPRTVSAEDAIVARRPFTERIVKKGVERC